MRGVPRQIILATWYNVACGLAALDSGFRLTALSTDAVEKVFGMLVSRMGFKPNIVLALQVLSEGGRSSRPFPGQICGDLRDPCPPRGKGKLAFILVVLFL